MANVVVNIPDGDFCRDKQSLGCKYEEHEIGYHNCRLFNQPIYLYLKEFNVNGEHQRAYKKCELCRSTKYNESGQALTLD